MRLLRGLLVLLLFFASLAWGGSVTLVVSDGSRPYREFQDALGEMLAESGWRISASVVDMPAPASITSDLIIAIGSDALRRVLSKPPTQPVLATLLTRQSYEKLLSEYSAVPRRMSAIFLDLPASRQAALLRHLLPEARRIGMLFSPDSRNLIPRYQSVFNGRSQRFEHEIVDNESQLIGSLNTLLARTDVLLAIPDANLFNRSSLKSLLMTALRAQKPIIGFSEGMVHAGALASIYPTPVQIARQTATLINTHGSSLPAPSTAVQFTVSINQNVAQSLGLRLPDESALLKAVQADNDSR